MNKRILLMVTIPFVTELIVFQVIPITEIATTSVTVIRTAINVFLVAGIGISLIKVVR